jgi:hypothetical protein
MIDTIDYKKGVNESVRCIINNLRDLEKKLRR